MIKAILFIVILCAFAFGFSQLAETSGHLSVTLNNHTYETTLVVALLAISALFIASLIVISLVRLLLRSPKLALRASRERKKRKGFEAISQGLLSVTAGDFKSAERHAKDALNFMPNEPLSLLLTAQTHQLGANAQGAEKAFRAMLEAPATKLIGLKGLHLEAERRDDLEASSQIAADAVKIAPSTGWAAVSLLKAELARKDYDAVLQSIDRQLNARLIDKAIAKRWRGLTLTAKAIAENDKGLGLEALGYLPDFAPTVAFAARKMNEAGDPKKALRLIEQAWKKQPHPLLTAAFKAIIVNDNAQERLKKTLSLVKLNENHIESGILKAKALIESQKYDEAREALSPYYTRQTCLLMADIALRDNNDNGRVKEWLSKSMRAKSDACYMGDGLVCEQWQLATPLTHQIDGVLWVEFDDNLMSLEAPEPFVIEPTQEARSQINEVLLALPHPPDDPGIRAGGAHTKWRLT